MFIAGSALETTSAVFWCWREKKLYKLTNGSHTYAGSGQEMYNGFLKL